MALDISIPVSGQPAKVKVMMPGPLQTICAQGTASRGESDYPDTIWGQLYAEEPDPLPATPPGTASQGTLTDDEWEIRPIPGASSSGQTPYPTNYLVIWAGYFEPPTTSYDVTSVSFLGMTSTQTDCDS